MVMNPIKSEGDSKNKQGATIFRLGALKNNKNKAYLYDKDV